MLMWHAVWSGISPRSCCGCCCCCALLTGIAAADTPPHFPSPCLSVCLSVCLWRYDCGGGRVNRDGVFASKRLAADRRRTSRRAITWPSIGPAYRLQSTNQLNWWRKNGLSAKAPPQVANKSKITNEIIYAVVANIGNTLFLNKHIIIIIIIIILCWNVALHDSSPKMILQINNDRQ